MKNQITKRDILEFEKNGYHIVKNLFTSDEIFHFRKLALDYFENKNNHFVYHNCGKVVPNAFEYVPELHKIITTTVLDIAKELIGDIRYVYHADLHYNMFNNWHRDVGNNYIKDFDTKEEIFDSLKIFKVGIYLQEHAINDQGLSLIPSSHKELDENKLMNPIDINSEIGDVIIFDQRLMHKGYYIDEEGIKVCKEIEKTSSYIERDKFIFFEKRRREKNTTKMSIFFGLALENNITKEFCYNIINRQNIQNGVNNYNISDILRKYLKEINLKIISL